MKIRKSRNKEKLVRFSSFSLFPVRKREAVNVWNPAIDHPTRRITQGLGIIKCWEDRPDLGRIPDTFT